MGSSVGWAINVGFGTTVLVSTVTYYICVRTRQHKEEVISYMMQAQQIEEAHLMPPEPPLDQHPFLSPDDKGITDEHGAIGPREYLGVLPQRKQWQEPLGTQDAKNVFKEVKK